MKSSLDVDEFHRRTFLQRKGINQSKPFQLDLIFPETIGQRTDLRHIPNDYCRSSLFTVRNKREPRKTLMHKKLFHYNETVTIIYSGFELRAEDDEIIWLQILYYGKDVPLGESFDFSIKNLVRDLNWSKNGHYYDKARQCISRLKANEILASSQKAYGKSEAVSLIQNYTVINDQEGNPTHYRVSIDPNLIVLFAGNTFTSHKWELYRDLSPVSRRLADYIESHKHPYPLALEKFREMCDSKDTSLTSWRQTVGKACKELVDAKIVATAEVSSDQIFVSAFSRK